MLQNNGMPIKPSQRDELAIMPRVPLQVLEVRVWQALRQLVLDIPVKRVAPDGFTNFIPWVYRAASGSALHAPKQASALHLAK